MKIWITAFQKKKKKINAKSQQGILDPYIYM